MSYTLTTYRRTLAPLLGVYEQGTADAGANSTTQLVCSTGLASGASAKSSTLPASLFEGKWIYMPGAAADDRSRLLLTDGGYVPATGAFLPDRAWSADPDTLSDRTFEITSLFSGTDLNRLVNEGLKRCFLVVELTVTAASDATTRHSFAAAAPWLTDPRWVRQVGELVQGEDRTRTDPFRRVRRGAVRADGGAVYLEGPAFNTTTTVYVRALKPAYAHCAAAATPTAFTQSGLVAEGDVCTADPTWVAWAAILHGGIETEHLESVGQAAQTAMQSRARAAARFTAETLAHLQPPPRTVGRLTYLGPALSGVRRRW